MPPSLRPFLLPARRVVRRPLGPCTCAARMLHVSVRRYNDEAPREREKWWEDPNKKETTSRETEAERLRQEPETARPRRPRTAHDPIPFELPDDLAAELADAQATQAADTDQGTITPQERRAFRRIFKQIKTRQQQEEDDNFGAQGLSEADARARVNAIVQEAADEAVRARGGRRQAAAVAALAAEAGEATAAALPPDARDAADVRLERRQAMLAQFPTSLRAAAGEALGIKELERAGLSRRVDEAADEEADARSATSTPPFAATAEGQTPPRPVDEACVRRQEKMEVLMLAQKTDFGLWAYMEAHVFSLPRELGLGVARPTAAQRRALATYAPLYPALVLHGMRLLDGRFGPAGSALALAVLPRVQALGLASYVLGAGTALYNLELGIRWGRQGDWAAALARLSEMQRAGLALDAGTLAVVRSMEYRLVPLLAPETARDRTAAGPMRAMAGAAEGSFAAMALRQRPDTAGLAKQLAFWRQQAQRAVRV